MGDANCTISIPDFGAVRVKALRVVHGMSVVSYSAGGESRHGEAFYSSKRTSGSFELTIQFGSYGGYHRVAQWLKRYMIWAGNPKALATPVRVQIPNRDFDKTGALESGVSFGDRVAATSYQMELAFVGARDPLEMGGDYVSKFVKPKVRDTAVPFFYPGWVQLSGLQNGWDTFYDVHENDDEADDLPFDLPDIDLPGLF